MLLTVLLALLGGGLWVGWRYTQSQYYVGATEQGQLAVFQGVPGEIAGLDLSNVHQTSPTRLDDLTPVAQDRVKQGIQATNESDAQRRLAELTADDPTNPNLKPTCPPSPAAGSVTPTVPTRPAASPSAGATGTGGSAAETASGRVVAPSSGPVTAPASSADTQPSDTVPPVTEPAGCRPTD